MNIRHSPACLENRCCVRREPFYWREPALVGRHGMKGEVAFAEACLGAIISILPVLLLLAAKEVAQYRPSLGRIPWFHAWTTRTNRLLPGPAVALGLLCGAASAGIALLLGELLIPNYSMAFRPQSALTATMQIAFVYAGAVEELAKTLLCVPAALLLSRAAMGERHVVLASAPFLAGAVGLGFALVENQHYLEGIPMAGFIPMVVARGGISAVVHTVVNFHFGLSLLAIRKGRVARVLVPALIVCILQHGVFDFFALSPEPMPQFLATALLLASCAVAIHRLRVLLPQTIVSAYVPTARARNEERDRLASDLGLLLALVRDPHALLRPPLHPPPFWSEDFPFPPGLHRTLLAPQARCPEPEAVAADWHRREGPLLAAALESGFRARTFDSAVFSDDPQQSYEMLRALGLDLTAVRPLRVIELSPSFDHEYDLISGSLKEPFDGLVRPRRNGAPLAEDPAALVREADRYIYTTLGLANLYGREVLVSFPHIHPGLRLFFLYLASGRALSDGLPDFRVVRAPSLLLGDLTGAFHGFVVLPLLDPLREIFLRDRMPGLPAEVLFLTERDLALVDEFGMPVLLGAMRRSGVPWANDYRRGQPVRG